VPCIFSVDNEAPESVLDVPFAKKMGPWSVMAVAMVQMSRGRA